MSLVQTKARSQNEEAIGRSGTYGAEYSPTQEKPAQYESIGDLLGVLYKYRATVFGVALGTFLLVLLGCLVITRKYQSTATIEINRDAATAPDPNGGPSSLNTQVDDVQTEVATDTQILQSPQLALSVIQKLGLANQKPFLKLIPKEERGLPLDKAPITREHFVQSFEKSLKVEPVASTRLIQVTFRSPDPVVAKDVVNTLSRTFISDYLERRIDSTSQVSAGIGKQLEALKKRVEDSEQALADYEHKTGLAGIDLPAEGSGLAVQAHDAVLDRLNTLNQELTTAEANRISAETVYKLIHTEDPEVVLGLGSMSIASGGTVLGQGGGLDLLRNLRAQEVPLKTQYADLATRYGAKNPRLAELQSQLNALDTEIASELKKIAKRAQNDYLYAQRNENAIRDQLKVQQDAANKLTDDTVELQVLAQQALSNRKLYEGLYSELNQANVVSSIRATHLDVVDQGQVPGLPVIPNYLIALPLGAVAGILFGIIAAFVRRNMDTSVTVPEDVEEAIQLPVIAHLPLFANGRKDLLVKSGYSFMIASPESPLSEAFRALRTSIVLSPPRGGNKTLLITSPTPRDGKSTVAFNLAVAFAQQNARVLLIDGDMRNADLHHHFGCGNESGLSDVLSRGSQSIQPSLVRHGVLETLFLLPAGVKPDLPVEQFASPAFDRLLAEAQANFDWVLIDSPPFLPYADAAVLSAKVDAVLPVIRSGVTSRNLLVTINNMLQRMHAPVLGFVLNGVKEDALKPYQSYGYSRKQEDAEYARA